MDAGPDTVETKLINLALQGGGAHGAFTWGVLDRLLEDERIVNSSLMREMRAIAFVTKLIDDGKICGNSMKRILIHGIEAVDVMAELRALDKLNADWDNLTHLMKVGRARADTRIEKNFDRLGDEPTVDIREEYL